MRAKFILFNFDSVSAIRFSPYELLEKLTALIAKPRAHLTEYSGVFARAAENRKSVGVKKDETVTNTTAGRFFNGAAR